MKTYLIETRDELSAWFADIILMGDDFYPITLQVFKGDRKHRSLAQNDLSHMWYREIADQCGDQTPLEIKRYCKLNIGVPILMENEKFARKYSAIMNDVPYEYQLEAMDLLDVTSAMSTKQMTEYLEQMEYHFIPLGFQLTNPEDRRR